MFKTIITGKSRHITSNALTTPYGILGLPCHVREISDGVYAFGELRDQVDNLMVTLATANSYLSWKTGATRTIRRDNPVSEALVVTKLSTGMVGRYIPYKLYDELKVQVRAAPPPGKVLLDTESITKCLLGGHTMPWQGAGGRTLLVKGTPIPLQCLTGEVGNGMDTFNSLYSLKYAFLIAMTHKLIGHIEHSANSSSQWAYRGWKCLPCADAASFVAGIKLKEDMVNFQLPIELWDYLQVGVLDPPPAPDSYTGKGIMLRLLHTLGTEL
jgi:hypothetical protein